MPTRRGWALVASAAVLAAAAAAVGIQELFPVACAALVVLGGAVAWVRVRPWEVEVARRVHPSRVPAGGSARVDLAIRNRHGRRSPVLVLRDRFDRPDLMAEVYLAPLDPWEATWATYGLEALSRGVYQLGPLEVTLSDPLGLARRTRLVGAAHKVVVHPLVERIPSLGVAAGADRESSGGSAVVGVRGEEFYAVREYRTGDDLRNVHWASTAHHDELMIRQEETVWEGRLTLFGDLRAEVHDPSSFEVVLTALASLADCGLDGGNRVRLVTTAGTDSGFGVGTAHRGKILDALAAASAEARAGVPRPFTGGGSVVAVTTDAATRSDLPLLGHSNGSRAFTAVVVERSATAALSDGAAGGASGLGALAGGEPSKAGVRLVRVPAGVRFASAWEQAAGARRL